MKVLGKRIITVVFVFSVLSMPCSAQFNLKNLAKKAVSAVTGETDKSSDKKTDSKTATVTTTAKKAAVTSEAVQDEPKDEFYESCLKEIFDVKDKWPTVENWEGKKVLKPSYEVDKTTRMAFAEEFMKTVLYTRCEQQSQMVVGKMHQTDNKVIKSRTIGSMVFNLNYHGDEYIVSLKKDFSTKKWMLDFTFNHYDFGSVPKTNIISVNIDGGQILEGSKVSSAYCVILSLGLCNSMYQYPGLEISDSSAQRSRKSEKNSDLGLISSWDR